MRRVSATEAREMGMGPMGRCRKIGVVVPCRRDRDGDSLFGGFGFARPRSYPIDRLARHSDLVGPLGVGVARLQVYV